MSDNNANALRRIFNAVETIFDGGGLKQEQRFTRSALTTSGALTLGAVYALCQNIAQDMEARPRLTMVAAPEGTDRFGAARRWELFFHLPKQRATLECAWMIFEDDQQEARIDCVARPFPPADSPLRKMVDEGKLLRRQLHGTWHEELRKHPALPKHFYNSDAALNKFVQQGLDPAKEEFSLTAKYDNRAALWVLQTRDKTYQVPFELQM